MKLKKYIIGGCIGLSLLSISCSKNYIDEIKPADGTLSNSVIFTSTQGLDNALTGIYSLLQNYASGQQNMYGLKTIQFNFDMRGNDLISISNNWWLYENNWSDNGYGRIATSARNAQIWNLFYKVINNANAVILNINQLQAGQSIKDTYVAEAKALRAYAYFYLARIYAFTYAKDPTAPAVPIYITPASSSTNGNPRSSLKDVYALITSDLETAAATLTATRVDKYRINKNVAQGLLAEVYQEMAMSDNTLWTKVLSNATAALGSNNFPLMAAYNDGFNTVSNKEWMWGIQFNATQSLSYASFFGYIEPSNSPYTGFTTRYNDIYINTTFVSLFSATDIRNRFIAAVPVSGHPEAKWVTLKFQDNATKSGDFVLMRAAEMYLIQAEAYAQTNQLTLAKSTLFALQSQRDPSAKISASATQTAILNEILLERRKELYAEMGVQYFDLKRYQQPLVRDGNQWSLLNIPATDNRWRWQLPQTELDANKSLTAADQNPL